MQGQAAVTRARALPLSATNAAEVRTQRMEVKGGRLHGGVGGRPPNIKASPAPAIKART